jgi:FKBP-type peptidyl-prolyl cis-trans isomerase
MFRFLLLFVFSTLVLYTTAQQLLSYQEIAERGRKWLETKSEQEGMQRTESGVLYKIIRPGNGASPTMEDDVLVHYKVAWVHSGRELFNTFLLGEAATIGMSGCLKGYSEPLLLMKEGSVFELHIPKEVGYPEGVVTVTMEFFKILPRKDSEKKSLWNKWSQHLTPKPGKLREIKIEDL